MNMQELLDENARLRERNQFLESIVNRGSSGNTSAYNEIRAMIISKVAKEVELDIVSGKERNWTRKQAERQIMSDLKWDLRVRNIADFKAEHIKPAKEYIEKYILPEELKKSRWI